MIDRSKLGIKGEKRDVLVWIREYNVTKGSTWSNTNNIFNGEEVYIRNGLFGIHIERLIR